MRKLKNWHLICMVLAVYFLALIPIVLLPEHRVDESTHSFVGLFIKDLIKDWVRLPTLSFYKIYNYAITYLIYYPKISIHYPPLTQIVFGLIFLFAQTSIFVSRFFILISSILFLILIYFISDYLYNEKKIALISLLIFATSPIILVYSVQAVQEIPFVLFFTLTVFLFLKVFEKGKKYYILAIISTVLTVLSKWQAITIVPLIFLYTVLFERKKLKPVLISLLIAGLILSPYYYVLYRTKLLFLPLLANVPSIESPKWYQLEGWLYYLRALIFNQFFLPVGLILLLATFWYLRSREKYWKLFLIWILVVYVSMVFIENKNTKYTINMLPAIVIPASYLIYNYFKRFNKISIAAFLILLVLQFMFALRATPKGYSDVEEISRYVNENSKGNILVNSLLGSSSPFIFEIARNNNFTHQVFNPCLINEMNESFDRIVERFGIDYVISEKNIESMTERQKEFINFINTFGQFSIEKEYKEFILFKKNNFTLETVEKKCNYICATREIVCSTFNKPSDSLR